MNYNLVILLYVYVDIDNQHGEIIVAVTIHLKWSIVIWRT